MDLSKLTTADKLILGGGIVYLISMFMPWWGIDTSFGDAANNGWDYFLGGWVPLILIIVMVVHVATTRFSDANVPDLPVPWTHAHLYAGLAAAIIVVLRLIVPSDECAAGFCIDLDRKYGLILAALAAIAVAVGGYLKFKDGEDARPATGDTGSAPF